MQNTTLPKQAGPIPGKPVPLTVALLTYNRAAYLKEAIVGVLSQTYRDFEFLILDNGSTDDTPQVVLGVDDHRIRYVRNPPGSPIEFNGVSAFHIARGDRIIVTHDDDIMEPTMLERQMRLIDEHPEVLLVWTNVSMMNHKGQQVQAHAGPCNGERIYRQGEYILSFLGERLWPVPSTMMLVRARVPRAWAQEHYFGKKKRRKSKQGKNVAGTADVFLPAHFNTKGEVAYISDPLLRYRLHPSQGTNSMDLSTPSIHLYNVLGKLIRKTPFGAAYRAVFANFEARYKTQRIISSTPAAPPQRRDQKRLVALFEKAVQHPQYVSEAGYPVLPLAVLLSQMRLLPPSALDELPVPPEEYTTATRSYYRWFRHRVGGGNLFSDWRGRRIVILGSALVSPLLILEAREAGCEVVCCIDSNSFRHGQHLLGLEIHPPGWLAQHRADFDTVVFSSEKDQEGYLADMVDMYAKGHVPSVSWKQIVAQATEGQGSR